MTPEGTAPPGPPASGGAAARLPASSGGGDGDVVGLLAAGIRPARKAAALEPVESRGYE